MEVSLPVDFLIKLKILNITDMLFFLTDAKPTNV